MRVVMKMTSHHSFRPVPIPSVFGNRDASFPGCEKVGGNQSSERVGICSEGYQEVSLSEQPHA